jgi:hypothetical protein
MTNDFEELYDDDEEETTAYCMTCKQKTTIEHAEAIWTQRGAPGTRGICSECGTTVFRMGRTQAHDTLRRPDPLKVAGKAPRKVIGAVTYINYSAPDYEFARRLSEDLDKIGIQTYLAENEPNDVQWATGVHPALVECKRMIVVMTPQASQAEDVSKAWKFFLSGRKPIYIAHMAGVEVPGELRSKPRVDFSGDDYKRAFRQLVQALAN